MNTAHKGWTRQEVRKVYKLWDSKNLGEIAQEIGRSKSQVAYIASEMRKVGFNLHQKRKKGYVRTMLKQVLEEDNK